MKFTKESLANALGLTTAVAWVVCSASVALLPTVSLKVTEWWLHGLSIAPLGNWNLNLAGFLGGGIILTISAWLFGYLLGWNLEYFSQE